MPVINTLIDIRKRHWHGSIHAIFRFFSLTISSTIGLCVAAGQLVGIGKGLLDADEHQKVWVYGTADFDEWYQTVLPSLPAAPTAELSPLEEVQSFFRILMLKKRAGGQLQRLQPTKHGVWEVKPPQVRLFGWFGAPSQLVVCRGVPISDVKDPSGPGYEPHRLEVIEVRKNLKLDYVAGDITRVLETI